MAGCVLYKHTGFTEVVEIIDVPPSTRGTTTQPVKTNPTSPLSGGRWGTPVRLGQPGVKRPTKVATPSGRIGGSSVNTYGGKNFTVVIAYNNGNMIFTIWETDNDGNLIRRVGPFIPG